MQHVSTGVVTLLCTEYCVTRRDQDSPSSWVSDDTPGSPGLYGPDCVAEGLSQLQVAPADASVMPSLPAAAPAIAFAPPAAACPAAPAAAPPARRSREPRANPKRVAAPPPTVPQVAGRIGHPAHPIVTYSITVGVRGGHAPTGWGQRCAAFLQDVALSGAFGQEDGGKAEHLHFQGVLEAHGMTSDVFCKVGSGTSFLWFPLSLTGVPLQGIVADIKAFMPVVRGSRAMVAVSPLKPGQTKQYMLGYVQKDMGRPTYRLWTHGLQHHELVEVCTTWRVVGGLGCTHDLIWALCAGQAGT